jgi:hypothetical protein
MGKYNVKVVDFDGETSSFGVAIPDLNAGNIAAQLALLSTLFSALEDIIIGTPRGEQIIAVTTEIAGVLPVNAFAQRETKWLVSGTDTAGLKSTIEIPTANLDLLTSGTGVLDISAGPGDAFRDALNAVWRSRAGNVVTVDQIIHVGRNL